MTRATQRRMGKESSEVQALACRLNDPIRLEKQAKACNLSAILQGNLISICEKQSKKTLLKK